MKKMNKTTPVSLVLNVVDAFVAMGGNPDKSGTVDANKLIQVIRYLELDHQIRFQNDDRH